MSDLLPIFTLIALLLALVSLILFLKGRLRNADVPRFGGQEGAWPIKDNQSKAHMNNAPYLVPVELYARLKGMSKVHTIDLLEDGELDGEQIEGEWFVYDERPLAQVALTNVDIPFTKVFTLCFEVAASYFLIMVAVYTVMLMFGFKI